MHKTTTIVILLSRDKRWHFLLWEHGQITFIGSGNEKIEKIKTVTLRYLTLFYPISDLN